MRLKLIASTILILLIILSMTHYNDLYVSEIHDEALARALGAFGIAKALNGLISLIQGTELSITPVGIGVSFSIGQILDPLNDLVEQFSWIMLVASVSLGIQKLLLVFSTKLYIQVLFSIFAGLTLLSLWYKPFYSRVSLMLLFRLFLFFALLRFAIIGFVYTETIIYNQLMQTPYEKAMRSLEGTQKDLEQMQNKKLAMQEDLLKKTTHKSSYFNSEFIDELQAQLKKFKQRFAMATDLDLLSEKIDSAYEEIFSLITIFVVESILLPLLFMWFLIQTFRWTLFGEMKRIDDILLQNI